MIKYLRSWKPFLKDSQLFLALKSYRLLLLVVCLSMIAQTALTLLQPWPIRSMIDHVIQHPSSHSDHAATANYGLLEFIFFSARGLGSSQTFDFLYIGIGLLMAIFLLNALMLYVQNITLARLGQQVVLRIRENLFSHLISLPHNFFEKARTGDLTSRISKDTADVQDMLESLMTIFVRSLPTVIGILIVSFTLDKVYALTFIFVIPLVYWANVVFTRRTRDAIRQQRCIEGDLASCAQEAFYHHKAVATLSLENNMLGNFLESGRESASQGMKAGHFQGLLTASLDLLIGFTSVLVLFVGILRILHGCLTVGQLMVFMSYLTSLFKPIREISKFTSRMAKSTAAVERIEEITQIDPMKTGAVDLPGALVAPPFRGLIQLEGVDFHYRPGHPVLKGLSLNIPAGSKVAVVGGSGSGKSTILQLIMRLYDPKDGEVRIDGVNIRQFKLASLRSQMAVVLQDSFIFNMSIADNIAMARPGATKEEVIAAAKAAEAHEFICDLPQGYQTVLGEGGAGLSGGQKRRISIARAFLRNAPIVLLDEPTTGLDAASEGRVTDAIRELTKGRTTIIVTHQLSTVSDADLIVVLFRGRIVDIGNQKELLERNGPYRRLWDAQRPESVSLAV